MLASGVAIAACASGIAAAATAATDYLYLPVLPFVDAVLLGYVVFFFVPVLATATLAWGAKQSTRFVVIAAAVTAGAVVAFSWAFWIGLIVKECVLQDNRCFD